jgi:serine/threonine protein kinase
MFSQFASAVYFLHFSCHVIHRDIKTENVLLYNTKMWGWWILVSANDISGAVWFARIYFPLRLFKEKYAQPNLMFRHLEWFCLLSRIGVSPESRVARPTSEKKDLWSIPHRIFNGLKDWEFNATMAWWHILIRTIKWPSFSFMETGGRNHYELIFSESWLGDIFSHEKQWNSKSGTLEWHISTIESRSSFRSNCGGISEVVIAGYLLRIIIMGCSRS